MRRLATLTFCTLALGASATAQLTLSGDAGSYPGPFALEMSGANAGSPAALLLSATPGPIPLSLIDPSDPRSLHVGAVGLITLTGVFLPPTNKFAAPAFTLPNNPSFVDVPIYAQGFTWPGPSTLVGDLTQPEPVRLAPAGKFRNRGTQFITPRAFFPMLRRGDQRWMMFGGGQGALLAQVAADTTEIYDPLTDSFVAGPMMTSARSLHTATRLMDGRYLICGGVDALNDPQDTAEIYDPVSESFTAVPPMTTKRAAHAAVLLPSGKVLVSGGLNFVSSQDPVGSINSTLQSTELYDPQSNTWSAHNNMALPRAGHLTQVLPDGRILHAGGLGWTIILFVVKVPAIFAQCEIYDPVAGSFSAAASMSVGRAAFPMTDIGNGSYLVSGGSTSVVQIGAPTNVAEVYKANAGAGTWTPAGTMANARALHAAYRIGNRVLAIGGAAGDLNAPIALASTEWYDIAGNSWSAGPPLPSARAAYGHYQNSYGQIHILGGASSVGGGVDNLTAWFYQ